MLPTSEPEPRLGSLDLQPVPTLTQVEPVLKHKRHALKFFPKKHHYL